MRRLNDDKPLDSWWYPIFRQNQLGQKPGQSLASWPGNRLDPPKRLSLAPMLPSALAQETVVKHNTMA